MVQTCQKTQKEKEKEIYNKKQTNKQTKKPALQQPKQTQRYCFVF